MMTSIYLSVSMGGRHSEFSRQLEEQSVLNEEDALKETDMAPATMPAKDDKSAEGAAQ